MISRGRVCQKSELFMLVACEEFSSHSLVVCKKTTGILNEVEIFVAGSFILSAFL